MNYLPDLRAFYADSLGLALHYLEVDRDDSHELEVTLTHNSELTRIDIRYPPRNIGYSCSLAKNGNSGWPDKEGTVYHYANSAPELDRVMGREPPELRPEPESDDSYEV